MTPEEILSAWQEDEFAWTSPKELSDTQGQLLRLVKFVRNRTIDEVKDLIPDTWLDDLLTGAKAVVGSPPFDCPAIERLLRGIRDRVVAFKLPTSKEQGRKM